MKQLLAGLLLGGMTFGPVMTRATVAQDFQIKKCPKCGESSITAKANCLKCGTLFSGKAAAAKAKSKAAAASKAKTPAKLPAPATEPAPTPAKAAPAKAAAAKSLPAKTSVPVRAPAPAKVSPVVATSKGKSAPVAAAKATPGRLSPVVTVELPANPYETWLTELPVKAVVRNTRIVSALELKCEVGGKAMALPNKRGAANPLVVESVIKLEQPGVEHRVWAEALVGGKSYSSEPVMVTRQRQTLPKTAATPFEVYKVDGATERALNASDPALPAGRHLLKFYSPSKSRAAMASKPVEVQVGGTGRVVGSVTSIALEPLTGTVQVTVMRQQTPVDSAPVQLVGTSDPQSRFALDTGAGGVYKFAGVPAGKYRLLVKGKERQILEVVAGAQPATATVALAPAMVAVTAGVVARQTVPANAMPAMEFTATNASGQVIALTSRAQAVEPGTYSLRLRSADDALWRFERMDQQAVTVGDEAAVMHTVLLRRRVRTLNIATAAADDTRPAFTLKPRGGGWPGAETYAVQASAASGARELVVQVGDYDVILDDSDKDNWTAEIMANAGSQQRSVQLRPTRLPLTIAATPVSETSAFNEKDLRFELRSADGKVTAARVGTIMLSPGNYELALDPQSLPAGWKLAAATPVRQSVRVPGAALAQFRLEPTPTTIALTLRQLVPGLRYLVTINARAPQALAANANGELTLNLDAGATDLRVVGAEFAYLDFTAKLPAPGPSALTMDFSKSAWDGEVTISRGEPLPPRRARLEATIDFPADENWTRYLRARGATLPKRVELTTSRDGRWLLPASAALTPAPYRVTLAWAEDDAAARTTTSGSGKQELKFDVAKRTVRARGEMGWSKVAGK